MSKKIKIIIISIIVLVLISGGTITAIALNPKPELNFAVFTDTHLMSQSLIGNADSKSFIDLNTGRDKMFFLSEAVLKTTVDKVIKSGVDFVLISGDLTDDGSKASHEVMVSQLKRIEDNGVEVFVINGNHDIREKAYSYTGDEPVEIPGISKDEFKQMYSAFGYENAEVFEGTLSYAADLNKKYRLIAIDPFDFVNVEEGQPYSTKMSEAHLDWIISQIKKSTDENKIPIAMTHVPFLQHLGISLEGVNLGKSIIDSSESIVSKCKEAGLKYIFTGHMHSQSIENNGDFYDIQTSSLVCYPVAYREVSFFKKDIDVRTVQIDKLKAEYTPSFLTEQQKSAVKEDFVKFAYDYVDTDVYSQFTRSINNEMVSGILLKLGIARTETNAAEFDAVTAKIKDDLIIKTLNMPVYEKDANGGLSLEAIVRQFGLSIEPSKYTTVFNFAMEFLKKNYGGDENFKADSLERKLVKYVVYSLFYILDYTKIFEDLNSLNSDIPVIDLHSTLNKLFNEGKLELLDNNLLKDILSLDIIPEELSGIKNVNMISALTFLKNFLKKDLLGLNFYDYLDEKEGEILLGALIDNVVFEIAAKGFFVDNGPADNNIRISKKKI